MLKMSPYAKYMKDIVTNKRRIPEVEISTMLINYTFKGGTPNKLGDPGVPTIPCSINGNYVRTALCDLGSGVSGMPLSLYRRLELDKLTPTEISLQMADKSTAFPIGICEDVPVVVANVTILTNFVTLQGLLLIATKAMSLSMSTVMSIRCTLRRNNIEYIASMLLKRLHRSILGALNALYILSR